MKKVVLLAGAIATGMAVAPQAANAAAPELNDVQEINLTDTQIEAAILKAQDELTQLKTIANSGAAYATADAADQSAINSAITALEYLIEEMNAIVDNNGFTNSKNFTNTGSNSGRLRVGVSAVDLKIRNYNTGLNNNSTCNDFVTNVINAVATAKANAKDAIAVYAGTLTPAEILDANATTAAGVDKTNLEKILEEALDILGAYDSNYQDPAGDKSDIYDAVIYGGKDGTINTNFDATVKGHIEAAKQLIERIEAAKNKDLTKDDTLDDQLLNQFELQTDVDVLTPLLEGYVVTFKIEANHVAADNVKDALTTELGKLKHHQDCKHTDTHKVADEIQSVIDQLDPDAAWDAKLDLHDRANSNPLAVQAWEAHLNGTSIPEVSTLYKKALGWDVDDDLKDAIDAFKTRYEALGACDVKNYINTFLFEGATVDGTIAKEYADLKKDVAALGTIVTPAQFAALDQRVTDLFKRIDNVEKAWEDIAKLNADDVKLQKEINDAKTKDGYTSTTIKNKWETGEQPELDTLEGNIDAAILAITKDAEFTGYATFEPTIKLEYDHHKWLDAYQKANYEATQTMIAAIDVRWEEYKAAKDFKITTTEKGTQKLADGTEVYTTQKNIDNGYTLETTKGEKDPTKVIYASFGDHLGFSHIDNHFTDHISGLSSSPGHGGMTTDIRYDRINKWYNDADAEYIGAKTYDAGWADAAHLGKLKDNTVAGLDVATTATDASAILVNEPAAKENVVFGWLQKEIHTTFAKAIENEKANKDLHDQISACEDYVQDAKDDIDNYAKFTLSHLEQKLDVYSLSARKTAPETRGNQSWDLDILYPGTTSGVPSLDPVALPAEYKTKEDATVITLAAGAHDYNNDFNCGHENGVWGWTKIATEIAALWAKEKAEYDKVASKALLDSKYVENKITEIEENVDDIKNEAYTRIIKNGFARVHNSINEARAWAAGVDGVCHEDGLKPCSADDVKNNPCGWDDPVASKALADLIKYYNEKLTLLSTEHNAENNDDHDTPVVDEDNIKEFAGYLNQMYVYLNDWTVKFVAADTKHKKALNDALDLAGEEAHALHHYSYDANQALINYNDAEKAAVNLWAVDFSKRKIGTFDGEEVTFQEFVKKIDYKMIADGAVDHTLDPDVYAAIKKFAAEPIANFQDYIDATEKLEGFIKAVAKVYYDHHQYTELKKLADGTKNFNWDADFQKAVDANNAAHVELKKELAVAQADLTAALNDVDKNKLYADDYDQLTNPAADGSYIKTAQDILDGKLQDIEKAWKEGKAADYSANGNEDKKPEVPGFKLTGAKEAVEAYVAQVQKLEKLYADNLMIKAELASHLQALLSEINATNYEVGCAVADGCDKKLQTKLDDLKKLLPTVGVAVETAFGKKELEKKGAGTKFAEIELTIANLEAQLRGIKKTATEYNNMVSASNDAADYILNQVMNDCPTWVADAKIEGWKNFEVRQADCSNPAVKYFDEIEQAIQDLKDEVTDDNSHEGNHMAAKKLYSYEKALNGIHADIAALKEAIVANNEAYEAQIAEYNKVEKGYECYKTDGVKEAANAIEDPDFVVDADDHSKFVEQAVEKALKDYEDEIEYYYSHGASVLEEAATAISGKKSHYETVRDDAKANDAKFKELYNALNLTFAAELTQEWKPEVFENEYDGTTNKYSDKADENVRNAYTAVVNAINAYLKQIKQDWYDEKTVANAKADAYKTLTDAYAEAVENHTAAVNAAQNNDDTFGTLNAAHVYKELTAETHAAETAILADEVYKNLHNDLVAFKPVVEKAYTDTQKNIITDWEKEESVDNKSTREDEIAAYQAAAKKYNELMANLNAYGDQLVKYFEQKDAFETAKTTIGGYDIMTPDYKDFDGNTEGAQDYAKKEVIEKAISTIDGKLNTLYNEMKTEAEHVAETINDADLTNNEKNDLNVDPAVGNIKTLIENLVKDAKKYEDACDANEAAFEPLHDNIKTVEADYAPESTKVTALPEPAQEAFNIAVKEDLKALADLQKDLEEAYMAENAVNFTKDNTDYEDLKEEIEAMYKRAVQAGADLGDIDGIDGVTVYDSDMLVDIVLYNRGYAVKGDFDFDGENTVTDVNRLNNLLWYEHILKAWAPGRVPFEGDIELTAEGNTVALALNNNVQTNGIQFDVTVPEGAYIDNVLGTDRVEGMRVLTACIADNTYRVLVISTLNASTINDNEGAIVTFNVCGGNEVEVSNVIATDGNSHRLNGAAVSVGITTEIDEIATEGETDIFSLDGIRQSVMKAGVNIVRGANGVAKKIFNK